MNLFRIFLKPRKLPNLEDHDTKYIRPTEVQDTLAGKMKRVALLKKAEDRQREFDFLDIDYKDIIEKIGERAKMGFISIDPMMQISDVLKEKLEGEGFCVDKKRCFGNYYTISWK